MSLIRMAAAVRRREVSPVELVEAHLRQIERLNPALNAFVEIYADEARDAARRAETAVLRGEVAGVLHGVPVTVKDSFDVAGRPTLCGSRLRCGHCAEQDSTAVRRFREAGAILLGKTNTPEFLYNYETDNHIVGRTNNPWNPELTPGGSSGGESAAIAACCSPGGIGSDGGGSIRVPAHFTGIVGLKPTPGRVSAAGHFPEIAHPGGLLGVAGPMARSAADVRLLFEVLAGHDDQDPFSAPVPLREADLRGLRVGVMEQWGTVPVQPEVREAVRQAARTLEAMGIAVDAFAPEGMERAPNLWAFFFVEAPAPFLREMMAGREAECHWTGLELLRSIEGRPEPSGRDVVAHLLQRDSLRSSLLRQMRQYPIVLLPPCGVVAFPHRQRRWETGQKEIGLFEAMMPATPFNLFGMPGVVIPFMVTTAGVPVGVQLVGRPYSEELLLELAVRLEQSRRDFPRPNLPRIC